MSPGTYRIVDVINLSSSADALLRDRVLAMRANGFDNRIVCMDGAHVAGLRRAGIPVHTVSLPRRLDPVRLATALAQLTAYLVRERVDLVHTHCSVPGVIGRLAARLASVPVVIHTVHGFYFHEPRSRLGRRAALEVERWCGRLTDVLLTQNREELGLAHAYRIGPGGRRRWIGNGIDVRRFVPARRWTRGGATITCVARFEPVKNHELLLEAAAALHRRGVRFRLRLVGEGPLRGALEARREELGLTRIVDFLGRREDVERVLAATDIATLVSLREGIPRAAVEAMAAGLPVVATDVPGTREVVRHGETGLLVPADDAAALAEALEFLIGHPRARRSMGRRARARAIAEFDERTVIDALERTYREALGARVPRATSNGEVAPSASPAPAQGAVTVGRNFSFRLAAQIGSALINVAGLALLGRGLSAAGYGTYAFYYSLIPILSSLSDAGVGIVATREMARSPSRARVLLGDAILIKLVVSVALFTALLSTSGAMLDHAQWTPLAVVVVAAFLDFSQDPSVWSVRARERLDLEGVLLLSSQLVWIALLALGVVLHAGLVPLLAAAPAAYAVRSVVGWVLAVRGGRGPRFAPARERWAALLAQGVPFGLAMFVAVVYGRVGVLLLKAFSSSSEIAHFNIAYLLSQPLGFVASALGLALFPALARQAHGDADAVRTALRHTFRVQLMVALPLTVALALLAGPVIALLFHGRDFAPAAGALRAMSGGLALIFFNLLARYTLTALDRQADYLKAVAWGLAVNAGIGALLVPRFGALGACAAYLTAEAFISVCCLRALRGAVDLRTLARDGARPFVAAAGMAAVIALLHRAGPWLAAAGGAFAYALLLWRSGALRTADLELGRRVAATFRPRHAPESLTHPVAPRAGGGRT
ncbi:MAG TPA: glycosyltransferase [Methylomirabilota bacterium]|nr:glycosyltransferase [Methylomirabilota bacterium]